VLEARGENTSTRAVQRHPWAGIGGGLRLEAPLLRTLHLELEAGSEVALVNSRFWFGDVLFHESSPVTGHAALNLVVRLPVN
jgi:hypothetical protein